MPVFNYGSDASWLATDERGRVAWLTTNGSGPIPVVLAPFVPSLHRIEDAFGNFVRSRGRPFEFGAGESQWQDAAAVGVFAFDWDAGQAAYVLRARPEQPVYSYGLPDDCRPTCVLAVDFEAGNLSATSVP